MKLSQKTLDIITELNDFSGSKIKNPNDIANLIELAEQSQKEELFYDIQFTAKYLNGLGKIMQSGVIPTSKEGKDGPQSSEEAKEKVMKEYRDNVKKFAAYINDLMLDADENTKSEFMDKFLALNRTSMVNLTTLIYDLSWLKKYYNSKRI